MLQFRSLDDIGDLITWEEFIQACEVNVFTDYDGFGYYALQDKQSNKMIKPSDVYFNKILTGFTHVMWYNR